MNHSNPSPRPLARAAFLLLLLLPAFAPARAQPPTITRWRVERVAAEDPEPTARLPQDGMAVIDLAIDSAGRPHIVYYNPATGELAYAWRDTGGWVIRPMSDGQFPSLALDGDGQPHVTYFDPKQERIVYARLTGNEWAVERTFNAAAPANAVAVDESGRTHIAYLAPGSGEGERIPTYARRDGELWEEQTIAEGRNPNTVTLALDPAGAPVVAFDNTTGQETYQVLAARPDAAPHWRVSIVDQWESLGESRYDWRPDTLQLASEPGGEPVLAYAIGIEFLIKPSQITYDVFVFRLAGESWHGAGGAYLSTLGYGESAAPVSLSVAGGGPDRAFVGMTIGNDLLVGETNPDAADFRESIVWQKVAPASDGNAVAVGADGQPQAAYATVEGAWHAARYEIVLDHSSYLPVILINWSAPAYPGATSLVSINSAEQQAWGESSSASISADGRFVAFESDAYDLGRGDRSWIMNPDIIIRDRWAGLTWNVTGHGEKEASHDPAISADGRFVAFESTMPLAPGDTDNTWDIYLYEIATGQITHISDTVAPGDDYPGAYHASISASGRFVAFQWALDGIECIVVHDRLAGTYECASVDSEGHVFEGATHDPAISADGRFVAFAFYGDGQFPGDHNGVDDIFLHDRQTGDTTRVSVGSNGEQANGASNTPILSANGRFIAFITAADNLSSEDDNSAVDVYRHDRLTGETVWVSRNIDRPGAASLEPSISADGRIVAFVSYASFGYEKDTNGVPDVFASVVGSPPILLSVTWGGAAGNGASTRPALAPQGDFVVFRSDASDLVTVDRNNHADIFLREDFLTAD